MAQSTVVPVNLGDVVQALSSMLISEFTGQCNEDPIKWIGHFERATKSLNDSARVQEVLYYFDGTAKYWYKQAIANKELTYAEFKKLFLLRFTETEEREFAMRKLKKMMYDPQIHQVSNFITDFDHWTTIVHPDYNEKMKIKDLFDRFSTTFQRKFHLSTSLNEIQTLDQFTKIAMRIEKGMKLKHLETKTLMQASVSQVNKSRDDILKELLTEIKSIKNDVLELKRERVNKPRKTKQCFKCGESWPECGCLSKCRMCSGDYPACGCKKKPTKNQGN